MSYKSNLFNLEDFAEFRKTILQKSSNLLRNIRIVDRIAYMQDTGFGILQEMYSPDFECISETAKSEILLAICEKIRQQNLAMQNSIDDMKTALPELDDDIQRSKSRKIVEKSHKRTEGYRYHIERFESGKYCPKIKIKSLPFATENLVEDGYFTGILGNRFPVNYTVYGTSKIINS